MSHFSSDLITRIGQEAVAEAIETHRRMGRPIVVWQDGEVRWIAPADIAPRALPGDELARKVLCAQAQRDAEKNAARENDSQVTSNQ